MADTWTGGILSYFMGNEEAKEEINLVDPNLIISKTPGFMNEWDLKKNHWVRLEHVGQVHLIVAKTEHNFVYELVFLGEDKSKPKAWSRHGLNKSTIDTLDIRFEKGSMNYKFMDNTGKWHMIQFVFNCGPTEESELRNLLHMKVLEVRNQEDFLKLVGAYDDWYLQEEPAEYDPGYQNQHSWEEHDPLQFEDTVVNKWIEPLVVNTNRNTVISEMEGDPVLTVYKQMENLSLQEKGQYDIQDARENPFFANKCLAHKGDQELIMLSDRPEQETVIGVFDLKERGQVKETWDTGSVVKDFAPMMKHGNKTHDSLYKLLTKKGYYTVDQRTKEKKVEGKDYKTDYGFSCMDTTGQGFWAIGDQKGTLRLYNKTMRAKTNLPVGGPVKSIDSTEDGKWMVVTLKDKLKLVPTMLQETEKLAFETPGKSKMLRGMVTLQLHSSDIQKYQIMSVNFSPARFSSSETHGEQYIITSTGNHVIQFDFKEAIRGNPFAYLITGKSKGLVAGAAYRHNCPEEVMVAEEGKIYAQTTRARGVAP